MLPSNPVPRIDVAVNYCIIGLLTHVNPGDGVPRVRAGWAEMVASCKPAAAKTSANSMQAQPISAGDITVF